MTRRRLPYAPAASLDGVTLFDAEVAWDTTQKRLRLGDGSTPGGRPLARLDDLAGRATADLANVQPRLRTAAPVNNLIAFLGDSITDNGVANTTIETRNSTRGLLFWLPFVTHQRFRSRQSLNFGVPGETSAQIAARVDDVIASGAGSCVVLAGANDVGVNDFAATTASLDAIYRALEAANVMILALGVLPRVVGASADYGFINRVNEWIMRGAERYANFKAFGGHVFGDPYSLTMAPKADYAWDGLHPTGLGMGAVARPMAAFLNGLLPHPGPLVRSVTDHFSASNPTGYINGNPMMAGDDGVKGAGVTGDVASGWRVTMNAAGGDLGTLAVAASKVTAASGQVAQRLVVSGSASGGFATSVTLEHYDFAGHPSAMKAGDVVEAMASITTTGGGAEIAGVALMLYTTQGGVVRYDFDGWPWVSDLWSLEPVSGVLATPEHTMAADDTLASLAIVIYLRNTASAARGLDLTVEQAAVRKVVA